MVSIINQTIFKGIAGRRPTFKPKYYIFHNDGGSMSAKDYIPWLQNRYATGQSSLGFAHYYIDRTTIARVEDTYSITWNAGNYEANQNSISYEVVQMLSASDADFLENEEMVFRQMAEDMKFYGDKPTTETVRLHKEFSSTSCPERSLKLHGGSITSLKQHIISRIQYYMGLGDTVHQMLNGVVAKSNKPQATKKQCLDWINQSIGKKYDFDLRYGVQCFDSINQYAWDNFGVSFTGAGAINLLETGNVGGFKVIKDAEGIYPEPGDIFIYRTYHHKWGHTGLVLEVDKEGMWIVDQNWDGSANAPSTKRYIKYTESWGVIVGWIRPPYKVEITKPVEEDREVTINGKKYIVKEK